MTRWGRRLHPGVDEGPRSEPEDPVGHDPPPKVVGGGAEVESLIPSRIAGPRIPRSPRAAIKGGPIDLAQMRVEDPRDEHLIRSGADKHGDIGGRSSSHRGTGCIPEDPTIDHGGPSEPSGAPARAAACCASITRSAATTISVAGKARSRSSPEPPSGRPSSWSRRRRGER